MATGTARAALAALTETAELRTWSLIVTIFGDMARAPGAEMPGPVLTALTGTMGIKPEATRVALHRLRKDGWIETRRAGRVSHYLLTSAGRAESQRATGRIFARHTPAPDLWHVAVAGPLDSPARLALGARMETAGYVALAPAAWLGPGPSPESLPDGLFVLDGTQPRLPDWLRCALAPPALTEAYAAFDSALRSVAAALGDDLEALTPIERAAIRILLVHGWRRLVLRHPDLPDAFFPADWPGTRVRARFHALLDRLGTTALATLTETAPV